MTLFWLVPAAVFVVGALVAVVVAGRAREEAIGLRTDAARWGELQPALVRVRDDAAVLREQLRRGKTP